MVIRRKADYGSEMELTELAGDRSTGPEEKGGAERGEIRTTAGARVSGVRGEGPRAALAGCVWISSGCA